MKALRIFLLLMLFPCVAPLSQTAMTKPMEITREASRNARETKRIEQVVVRFGDAWAVNDIATLDSLLSADYIHTDFFGRVQNRGQWLDYMKDRKAKDITNRIAFEDVQIRIYGDTAVVTGRNIIKGALTVPANEASTEIRFTQVLHKTHGEWMRIGFQATDVNPAVVH
jgi:ketosteroid isomerase-like protein